MASVGGDPTGGSYFYITPANGVCDSGDSFKLRDGDNYDTSTLTQLPSYTSGVTGIRWCSGSSLHACVC